MVKVDKEVAYSLLDACKFPDRTIKFYIVETYNPPYYPYNTVSSQDYQFKDFEFNGEVITNIRFEYDLNDELVYIYYKTDSDQEEKLFYTLSKKFIEHHFEPYNPNIKLDIDLTLPGQTKASTDSTNLVKFLTYIKNTHLTAIRLTPDKHFKYETIGGHDFCNDVHPREWNLQAKLDFDTMAYNASNECKKCDVKFRYFYESDVAYFEFISKYTSFDIAFSKDQLEKYGVRIIR